MNRLTVITLFVLSVCLLNACSLNHKQNTLEEMSYRSAGYEKNQAILQTESAQPNDPAINIERRVESLPGVQDASAFFYGVDTLIVGIDTIGPAQQGVIENRVRQALQGEAKHSLVYLVGIDHPDLLARVKVASTQIQRGGPVNNEEILGVVNGVWKTIRPFNFLSKS